MESELSSHLQSHHKNKVLSYTCTRSERLMLTAMHAAVDTVHADDAVCYSECLLLLFTMLGATVAVVLRNITHVVMHAIMLQCGTLSMSNQAYAF